MVIPCFQILHRLDVLQQLIVLLVKNVLIVLVKFITIAKDDVLALLNHPDKALVDDIGELWTIECNPIYYKTCWMNMMQKVFEDNRFLQNVKIEDIFEKW